MRPPTPLGTAPTSGRFLALSLARARQHPAAAALKRLLRNVWWSVKGRSTVTCPLPPEPRSVLFVCLGNICRSPFGSELTARLFADAGLGHIRCQSAGIRANEDARSPREACEVSATYGVSLEAHRPQQLTPALIESSDLIVVMEHSQLQHLRTIYPGARDRILLLSLYDLFAGGAFERYNIADPFGHPRQTYEACYARIRRAAKTLVAAMASSSSFSRG